MGAVKENMLDVLDEFEEAAQHTHSCPCGARRTCTNMDDAAADTFFKCSNCGCFAYSFFRYGDKDHADDLHFCPNCGAKVVG